METFFHDHRDPSPGSRRVFSFHRSETLAAWLPEPKPSVPGWRPRPRPTRCQLEGIANLEASFAADRPRALIQMATGAGKTYTACNIT